MNPLWLLIIVPLAIAVGYTFRWAMERGHGEHEPKAMSAEMRRKWCQFDEKTQRIEDTCRANSMRA